MSALSGAAHAVMNNSSHQQQYPRTAGSVTTASVKERTAREVLLGFANDPAHRAQPPQYDEHHVRFAVCAMGCFPRSSSLQAIAFRAVHLVIHSEADAINAANCGIVGLLLDAMRLHKDDPFVVGGAATLLALLSRYSSEVRRDVVAKQGVEEVIRAIWRLRSEAVVQQGACGALGTFALRNPEAATLIFQQGGVEALITVLNEHRTHIKVQCNGLSALSLVGSNYPEVARRLVVPALRAMTDHPGDSLIQRCACRSLGTICSAKVENRDHVSSTVIEQDGLDIILNCARDYFTNDAVMSEVCYVLGNLCLSANAVTEVIKKGGPNVILTTLETHHNPDTVLAACGALSAIVRYRPWTGLPPERGADALLSVIKEHRAHPKIVVAALHIVWCSTLNNENTQTAFIQRGCVDAVLLVVVEHHTNTTAHQLGCAALWNLLSSPISYTALQPKIAGLAEFINIFSDALCVRRLYQCLTRSVDPECQNAVARCVCTRTAFKPNNDVKPWEGQNPVQLVYLCCTCASPFKFCQACATRCHSGHVLSVPFLYPASCDCPRTECTNPPQPQPQPQPPPQPQPQPQPQLSPPLSPRQSPLLPQSHQLLLTTGETPSRSTEQDVPRPAQEARTASTLTVPTLAVTQSGKPDETPIPPPKKKHRRRPRDAQPPGQPGE